MTSLAKLMLSSILITVIVLGFNGQVVAQVSSPNIYVDAPSTVVVSTEFDVIIWIRDIQSGWGLTEFYIQVNFDPNDVEFVDSEFLDPGVGGWVGGGSIIESGRWNGDGQSGGLFDIWTEDRAWFVLTFHCLRSGPTPITVTSPPVGTIVLVPIGGGSPVFLEPEPVTVIVNQIAPVGGIVTPVDKLEILSPYLVLAGLIAGVVVGRFNVESNFIGEPLLRSVVSVSQVSSNVIANVRLIFKNN